MAKFNFVNVYLVIETKDIGADIIMLIKFKFGNDWPICQIY